MHSDVLICHINLASGFRGGERQTELLIRELQALGYRQRLIARRDDELISRLQGLPGLERVGISKPFAFGVRACRGADILHAHEAKAGHLACIGHSLYRIPYVITRRVDKPPRRSLLNRRLYRNAAAVVAISSPISEILRQSFGPETLQRIPSAHAGMQASPEAAAAIRDRFAGRFLLVHAGALVDRNKGQMTLIAAMRRLRESCPELQLLLLGAGADEARLRQAAQGLKVSFEGFSNRPGDYLAAADLFVYPSHFEGLGSVLLDAMHARLAIIASRAGGIPDLVQDRHNGLLVPPGDVAALAAAIEELYSDIGLRQQLADAGHALAQEYSAAKMAQRYASLYASIDPSESNKPRPGRSEQ